MKRLFKQVMVGVVAAAMTASIGAAAFAQKEMDNMVLAGYDTTDPYNPNRIYNEVIDGKYTNKQVLVPVAPEWKQEGYERVYPYAGYSRMYLDGKKQNITAYNNLFPQWETRRHDFMWEIKSPYMIWERQQTKVENKAWTWDFGNDTFGIPDEKLKTRTNREAYVVDITMKDYGFGNLNNAGAVLSADEQRMYSDFSVAAINEWNNFLSEYNDVKYTQPNNDIYNKLSLRDDNNCYIVSDEEIAEHIPVVISKYVTAKFNEKGNEGLATKSVAAEYLKHMNDGWQWDFDSFAVVHTAKISWTKPTYEMAEPYDLYQYLVVNGVVLDGSNGRARVIRKTGGVATPAITWKFAFFQNAIDEDGILDPNVYEVVEQKYVDGVPAVDKYNNPIYRVPTGAYGKTYFTVNGNFVEYWVKDNSGNKTLLGKIENWTGNLGGIIDAFTTGSFDYIGNLPAEQYKMLP